MAGPGDCRCGRACWERDYTEADEISLVRQVVRRSISWPEMVTNGGHCRRHLPSNHTESTWKLTLSIRPPAVYENRHKLANVCEVTLWFAYMNLGTLPYRKCGIPSLNLSLLWQKSDLSNSRRSPAEEMWYIGERCPPPNIFPLRSISLSECSDYAITL